MFKGTEHAVATAFRTASAQAGRRGHAAVGSEHLLLAVALGATPTADLLHRHGLHPDRCAQAIDDLDGMSAAVVADSEAAGALGVDLNGLLDAQTVRPSPPAHRILPLGWRRAQRRCAAAQPPIGGDAQAAFEAALLLALANWHRCLTDNHLAQVLLGWSRAGMLIADRAGAHRPAVRAALAAVNPARRRVRGSHLARAQALAA